MKITTIQLFEDTKKKLEKMKHHPRESYDKVLKRILEAENIPSVQEMFAYGDRLKQKKKYTTEQVIEMSHKLRSKR